LLQARTDSKHSGRLEECQMRASAHEMRNEIKPRQDGRRS
jgi:hypothetical protein